MTVPSVRTAESLSTTFASWTQHAEAGSGMITPLSGNPAARRFDPAAEVMQWPRPSDDR
jgi:hypothetical protein